MIIRQAKEQDATEVKESLIPWVSQPHVDRKENFSEEWLHEVGGHQQPNACANTSILCSQQVAI